MEKERRGYAESTHRKRKTLDELFYKSEKSNKQGSLHVLLNLIKQEIIRP